MHCIGLGLLRYSPLLLLITFLTGCVVQFVPQVEEERELLVVQGLITNLPTPDTIKLSKSLPLGQVSAARPVTGCSVSVTDDLGNICYMAEISEGTYVTTNNFQGVPGRSYTLHVRTNSAPNNFDYESYAMEMKPVPPIDSLYYEKIVVEKPDGFYKGVNTCQILLDTQDPSNQCRYYRWDFTETWIFRLNFEVPNQLCYITEKSHPINIKSTAAFNESRIKGYPLNYISNATDRLKTKYSIIVNQYSLNEDEYAYWQKIQNIAFQVGGLYDIIPASVPSNIKCIQDPTEKVLGYFSVSAKSSKRIFIKDKFEGIIDAYKGCVTDTVGRPDFTGVNISAWILFAHVCSIPCVPFYEITTHKECTDCTLRGSLKKPDFWQDDK
jgi:hypothetical protein